jgi:alcohol dehydrogenase class IV
MNELASVLRLPANVVFGEGSIAAAGRLAAAVGTRALICTDRNVAAGGTPAQVEASLREAGIATSVFKDAEPDLPTESAERCVALASRQSIDLVVGVGGGSCLDLAKLTALRLSHRGPLERFYGESLVPGPVLPVVAVPTTAGTGSEVSPVAVLTDPDRRLKVGVASRYLVPEVAVCDPLATLGCPPAVTAFAGIDALAHAVEAYTAPPRPASWAAASEPVFRGRNPLSDGFALTAINHIGTWLERAMTSGGDRSAREALLFGSLCAGIAFSHAGTAGAHALQYPVGAATGTPHGLGVGLFLPYTLTWVSAAAEDRLADVALALGAGGSADAAIAAIERLCRSVGVPGSLADIGVKRDELPRIAGEALGIERLLRNSPRPLDRAGLEAVLEAAWVGDRSTLRGAGDG